MPNRLLQTAVVVHDELRCLPLGDLFTTHRHDRTQTDPLDFRWFTAAVNVKPVAPFRND
jgi:hypothetical protein